MCGVLLQWLLQYEPSARTGPTSRFLGVIEPGPECPLRPVGHIRAGHGLGGAGATDRDCSEAEVIVRCVLHACCTAEGRSARRSVQSMPRLPLPCRPVGGTPWRVV